MRNENQEFLKGTRPVSPAEAVVRGPDYRFTVLAPGLLRLEYQAEGRFTDGATQCVLDRQPIDGSFRLRDTGDRLEIVTENLRLTYDKRPFSPEGLKIVLTGVPGSAGATWRYGDAPRDLGGTARTLDGVDGALPLEHGLMSREGWSLLDDSRSAVFDADGLLRPREAEGVDLYFFGTGRDYKACLRLFYHLTGMPPLVPRFALGSWWSRYYPYSQEAYLKLMDRFRAEGIPLSVAVIDMDWHLTDIPREYGTGWTGYTWNRELFPDPEGFLRELHARGLKTTLNLHPADGVRPFEEAYPAVAEAMGLDPAAREPIPFAPTDPSFMEAYFSALHHPLEDQGVDFWWVDWQQGRSSDVPGLDPLWLLNHAHFLDSGREGRRPMTFSRYAGPGSHRYPIGFSGDTVTTWESLRFQPYFTACASNIGFTWWSHDIGGHMQGYRDDELTARWVQLGVFSPIMRLHSTRSEFYGKEPWNYTPEVEKIMGDFLRLRHRLIPYLYTMDYLTAREGTPLVRPLYWENDEWDAYGVPNEYWFGSSMLVCPITEPRDRCTGLGQFTAWLPSGLFYDFFTGDLYRGGRRMNLHRPLDTLPVLVPAGSVLPLAADPMRAHLENPKRLEVRVYHGAAGSFTLMEDDCSDRTGGAVYRTVFTYDPEAEAGPTLQVTLPDGDPAPGRTWDIRFQGVRAPEKVTVTGAELLGRSYDDAAKTLRLDLGPAAEGKFTVTLALPDRGAVNRDKLPRLFGLLNRAQLRYALKDQIYYTAAGGREPGQVLSALAALDIPRELASAVAEILTSDL